MDKGNPSCWLQGMLPEKQLLLSRRLSLGVDYFQELFLCPLSHGFCFGGAASLCLCMLCLGKYSLFPVVSSTVPSPSPSPWCPHASTELVWLTGNVISSELQEAVGQETVGDGISKPSQSWKGERSLLKVGQPAAEWSPRMFSSLSCLPPGLASWVFLFYFFYEGVGLISDQTVCGPLSCRAVPGLPGLVASFSFAAAGTELP